MSRVVAVSILALCWPGLSLAASFDCGKAASAFEKTICADPDLSKLDEELAAKYAAAKAQLSSDGQKILRDSERRWLQFASDICLKYKNDRSAAECLGWKYKKRVQDMDTAAVTLGPFVFSRIDYFFAGPPDASGQPYEGQTSYPRIDSPISESVRKWNAIMAPTTKALGTDWCDGDTGDVDNSFTLVSATDQAISVQIGTFFYCHGAAHGSGSLKSAIYVMVPEPRPLSADDLFLAGTGWREFLISRCYPAIKTMSDGSEFDQKQTDAVITNPEIWSLTKDGLVITIDAGRIMPQVLGDAVTTIPWSDLKPYLKPAAPIPH